MIKVSVIYPVYNSENYIELSLESLMQQTLEDIEIIILDDGSTDSSLEVIKAVLTRNPLRRDQVVLVSRENKGVSATRQEGVDLATGEYLIHMDSDDRVSSKWLELMYQEAKKQSADVVVCDYYEDRKSNLNYRSQKISSTGFWGAIDLIEGRVANANWNKMVKRSLCETNKITFEPELKMGEDFLFSLQVFLNSSFIAKVNEALYFYNVENEKSLTNVFDSKSLSDLLLVVDRMQEILEEFSVSQDKNIISAIDAFKINTKRIYFHKLPASIKNVKSVFRLYPEVNNKIDRKFDFFYICYLLFRFRLCFLSLPFLFFKKVYKG